MIDNILSSGTESKISSESTISILQHVQNSAARLVAGLGPHDHITQALKDLHWLSNAHTVPHQVQCAFWCTCYTLASAHHIRQIPWFWQPSVTAALAFIPATHNNTSNRMSIPSSAIAISHQMDHSLSPLHDITDTAKFKCSFKSHFFNTVVLTAISNSCTGVYSGNTHPTVCPYQVQQSQFLARWTTLPPHLHHITDTAKFKHSFKSHFFNKFSKATRQQHQQ